MDSHSRLMNLDDCIFVHVPRTAGRSILSALGFDFIKDHRSIVELCRDLGEDYVRSKFKITCVRNPWDRAVSWWSFFGNMGIERIRFEEWIKRMSVRFNRHMVGKFQLTQSSYWKTDNGDVLIDKFIRFEKLKEDFADIANILGILRNVPSIGTRDKFRNLIARRALVKAGNEHLAPMVATDDYRDMYTSQESIDLVGEMDAETIKRFGYDFK